MAWRTGFSTLASSACPSVASESSSSVCEAAMTTLTDVLQPNAPQRFSLSGHAARGILRRARKRGRSLPGDLESALSDMALTTSDPGKLEPTATRATIRQRSKGTCRSSATPSRRPTPGADGSTPTARRSSSRLRSVPRLGTTATPPLEGTGRTTSSLIRLTGDYGDPILKMEEEGLPMLAANPMSDRQMMVQPASQQTVRRLTPVETERLMGWPDGWTIVPDWKEQVAARRSSSGRKAGKAQT